MKKLLLIAIFLTISISVFPQRPYKVWDKTLGGSDTDKLRSALATNDGGYILLGTSYSPVSGEKSEPNRFNLFLADIWVIKVDSMGRKVWDKTLGGSGTDVADCIVATDDGGYIIAGASDTPRNFDKTGINRGSLDFWIIKINSNGVKVWDKTLGGSGYDEPNAIVKSNDGGFIIGGYSQSPISGEKSELNKGLNDFWIVKIDNNGDKIWDRTLGGTDDDILNSMITTTDNGIIAVGNSKSNISADKSESNKGNTDYWIVKINNNGIKEWDKTFGGNDRDNPYSIAKSSDNNYIIAGTSSSRDKSEPSRGGLDYWILKIDNKGQKIWEKTLGGNGADTPSSIIVTNDNGIIICGASISELSGEKTEDRVGNSINSDLWIVKIDNDGQKIWDKSFGGTSDEGLYSSYPFDNPYVIGIVKNNESFLLAGTSSSNISGDKSENSRGSVDYWLSRVSTNACPNCITGITSTAFTSNDHFCATQSLCAQQVINKIQSDPKIKILRGDLAKITYLSLIGKTATTNAQNFPVPFTDLQNLYASDTTYYKYAKVLSYLDYADGRPPFDRRDSSNFNPTNSISRSLVLKVLLEAWNIDEFAIDNAAPMPYTDAGLGTHPQYRYINKAYELGIITGTTGSLFSPDANCTREDAFLMLYRLMTNTTITKPSLAQINAGFFVPGQYRPDNLGLGSGTDRGNFNHYTKTSFAMDGVVPLIFAHSYNSYTTELPNEMYPNLMGKGWTHSFNCYATATGTGTNTRLVIHYPDGKLHFYKKVGANFVPESIGVFDEIVATTTSVKITTPSKIEYYFEKMTGQAGNFWLIKTIKDRNSNTLTFTNELGINNIPRLKTVADPAGRSLTFAYLTGELRNYLSQVTLAGVGASFNGRNVQFTYHPLVLDGDGIRDLATYKEYDLNGAFKTTSYAYYTTEGSEHLLKTITLPKGNVIDNTYEKRKLRSSQTLNGATVVQQMNTNWQPAYNTTSQSSTGSVSVTAGSVTKTTNYTHNSNGLAQTINSTGTNPVNLRMEYGVNQDPTSVSKIFQKTSNTDSTGVRVEYYPTAPYNVKLVKTAKAVGDSITQEYTYTPSNDIYEFTNGRGNKTTFGYDIKGNLTTITHPLGQPTTMVRNPTGTISKVTTPAGIVTNFTYNDYGNLLTTSTPNGSSPAITTSATYDALSRVTSKTDARNQTVTYDYFANDLLKKMNAPLSYYVAYNYDANDNNTTITNAKGNATTNVYNTQTDQLMSRSFGAKTESFTYYEDGSLKTFTNGRNQVFTFTYDPSGRITNDSYATYTYNPEGTLNTVTHTQGTKTYTLDYDYDVLRRLNKTTCDGFAVQYSYDNNNNLTQISYPDGKTVTYTYDAKDRLTTVTDWLNRVTTYVYDNDGKILSYTLPNGSKAIYSYDAAGRPTGISHQKSSNAVICSSSFVLDQGGNHLEENIIEPYTTAPALTAGTTTYTTNARNETTQVGSASNTFDGNGAITSQAGQTITWDTKDNVLTAYGKTFYYDGNETRRAKTGKRYVINELSNSVIAETNDAGTYLYYYVYGPTGLLYRQNASTNAIEYYHYDFRGSTVAMTDASQTIVKQYQYDAYGKILQQTPAAATDDNPFRYVGQHGVQYEDPNLYFMRARYYDPTTGKFLSEDPIWNTNLFAYGGDNPVMGIDPNGLASVKLGDFFTTLGVEFGKNAWNTFNDVPSWKEPLDVKGNLQSFGLEFSLGQALDWAKAKVKIKGKNIEASAYLGTMISTLETLVEPTGGGIITGWKFKKNVTADDAVKILNAFTIDTEGVLADKITGGNGWMFSSVIKTTHECTVAGWGMIFDLMWGNSIQASQNCTLFEK